MLIGLAFGLGCHPLPDGRTAVEHEEEARRLRSDADQARAAVAIQETTRPMPTGPEMQADPTTPLAGAAQGRAAVSARSAEQHERIARRLREDADVACARVAATRWRTCPIPPASAVEEIPRGVRIKLAAPVEAEATRAEMSCAVARAHVERPGPDDEAACPLLVVGAQASFIDAAGAQSIEITAQDETHARDVRERARKLLPK